MSERHPGAPAPKAEANFVLRMRLLREAHGLSQAEVSARVTRMGVPLPQQTIARIETGKRSLRLDEAEAIARALASNLTDMSSEVVEITDAERQFEEAKQLRHELSAALRAAQTALEQCTVQTQELAQQVHSLEAAYAEAEATEQMLWPQTRAGREHEAAWHESERQNSAELHARIDAEGGEQ